MALTFDSMVKELLESPEAVEICKKHGMDLTDKRIKMVKGCSARKLAELPGTGLKDGILMRLHYALLWFFMLFWCICLLS